MGSLERVLQGREERSSLQARLFQRGLVVVQVSLNIPGFPKRLEGDILFADRMAARVLDEIRDLGGHVLQEIGLLNGAGYAVLVGARLEGSLDLLKRRCIALEENIPWGRAFDLDVLSRAGTVSRHSLGEPPRRCLLCGEEAKSCAREGRHDRSELRKVLERLLMQSLQEEASSFSSRDRASSSSSFR